MNSTSISILLVVCALFGCSGSDPKALTAKGTAALGSGDATTAIESFDAALKQMDAGNPDYLRAKMGRCQALARQDPKKAKDEFLALAGSASVKLREQDYVTVANELVKKGAVVEAVEVMDAGLKAFPESPSMQILKQQVVDASKKSKDPAALNKLKGLGYAGDDSSK